MQATTIICLSPTDFVSGDPSLQISYPSVSSPNTTVTCTTPGDLKWVYMGLSLPHSAKIEEITICYQVSNPQSFISQIRLTEMSTPDKAIVIHDDGTDLQSTTPICYASHVGGKIPSDNTAVTLALRLNFKNTNDKIMLGPVKVQYESECCCANVRDFGAIGDSNSHPLSERYASLSDAQIDYPDAESLTDDEIDWAAIQTSVNIISNNTKASTTICIPYGTYIVNRPIIIRYRVTLFGNGISSIIQAKVKETIQGSGQKFWGHDYERQGIIDIRNANEVIVRDLVIDQNSVLRRPENAISYSLLLYACSNCRVENVTFKDAGLTQSPSSGPVIDIVATDNTEDFNHPQYPDHGYLPFNTPGPSIRNVIHNCKFVQDPILRIAFAIKLVTVWFENCMYDPTTGESKCNTRRSWNNYNEYNIVDTCSFEGDFFYDHVSFAGGGTKHNKIINCLFKGKGTGAITLDKGANNNIVSNNTITSISKTKDSDLQGSQSGENTMWAIHDTGLSNDHRLDPDHDLLTVSNIGNVISYNTIEDCGDDKQTSGTNHAGIALQLCNGSIVVGNRIKNIIPPKRISSQSGTGVGIFISRDVNKCVIQDNTISECPNGIFSEYSINTCSDLSIVGNFINCREESVMMGPWDDSIINGLIFANNFAFSDTTQEGMANVGVFGGCRRVIISNNLITGGYYCIFSNAKDIVIQGNVCKDTISTPIEIDPNNINSTVLLGNL